MKSSSSANPQKASPLMNLAIIIVLLLTALPIVLFALYQINPPSFGKPAAKAVQADTAKHSTAAERRAEREEARKEAEAATAAAAKNPAPIITTTTVPAPGGAFGPGMDFGPGAMGPGMATTSSSS